MQVKIVGLKHTFYNIQTDKVKVAISAYYTNMNKIKTYYHSDSIDLHFSQIMNDYKVIKKVSSAYDSDYSKLKANLNILNTQIVNLKFDIENNTLPKDSISYFIKAEANNILILNKDLVKFVLDCDNIISIDDSLSDKITELINSYSEYVTL